jgi:hypothetical protein
VFGSSQSTVSLASFCSQEGSSTGFNIFLFFGPWTTLTTLVHGVGLGVVGAGTKMASSLPTITTAQGGEKIRKAPHFEKGFMKKELLSGVYNLTGELNVTKVYLPSQHRCTFAQQKFERETFFEAIAKADYQTVKKMVHVNPDLGTQRGIAGDTGLHVAAGRGLAKITKFLLQVSEIDAVNEAGWSALHIATMNGEAKCAEILAAAGSSLKLKDKNGVLPEVLKTMLMHI